MNHLHAQLREPGIRKAAVLVASLGTADADAVLERLGPEQAARVRRAVVDLGEISPREQRRIVDEFHRVGTMVPEKQPAGIELTDRPFSFLQEAEGEKLAGVLMAERPQTIALVLSHLSPARAGRVLGRLPGSLQVEVIHRLVDLEEADPEILREVERVLQSRLAEQLGMRRRVAGLRAVAGILDASAGDVTQHILDNLAARDESLAERLRGEPIPFDDLAALGDASLGAVVESAGTDLLLTALVGASPELVDRMVGCLPYGEADAVRHKLDHPGPIRLSDVEDARDRIAEHARRLVAQGVIEFPQHESTLVC